MSFPTAAGISSCLATADPVARYGAHGGYRLCVATSGYAQFESRNVDGERRTVRAEEQIEV